MNNQTTMFREIHKNTWLKRLNCDGRKFTVGPKRSDKSWTVFCVHDDTDAWIEGYVEPRQSASHMPEWKISLQSIQHISHALVSNENEFEFVITLNNSVVRLQAMSWEIMKEWVDTLRQKLREMRILSPKENLYTKLPEFRPPLLPTRDPTSPLPRPPPVPAAIVPGIEPVPSPPQESSPEPENSPDEELPTQSSFAMSNTLSQNYLNMVNNPISVYSIQVESDRETAEDSAVISEESPYKILRVNAQNNALSPRNSIRVDVSLESEQSNFEDVIICNDGEGNRINDNHGNIRLTNFAELAADKLKAEAQEDCSSTNITIIQVSNSVQQQNVNEPETFSTYPECSPSTSFTLRDNDEYKSNVQIIPSFSDNGNNSKITMNDNNGNNKISKVKVENDDLVESSDSPKTIILSTGITNIAITNDSESSQKSTVSQVTVVPSNAQDVHYEKVFLATSTGQFSEQNIQLTRKSPLRNSNSVTTATTIHPTTAPSTSKITSPARCKHTGKPTQSQNHQHTKKSSNSAQQAGRENISPAGNGRPVLTRGLTEAVITSRPSRIDLNRINSRTVNNTKPTVRNNNLERNIRSESLDQQRQRSSSTSEVPNRPPRQHRPPHLHESSTPSKLSSPQKRLTLREQQVNLLRREIMHPGGVRLQLRRKDCMGSVGWVDAFGAVWVAGWKQKEHPVLYNAFHIGDQLVSIAGFKINTASEANKVIRNASTLFVEILVRRIPFGRAYAVRRDREGQCLGLIRDGNTATIVEVIPNSLAAKQGLTHLVILYFYLTL
ncbi:hypothetical protein ACFFRR_007291 [Megaselia abdita]